MAASHPLDPSTTLSASEAFHHPLPQVRQFHRSLTSALDDKNERLRILVGGSYRQLLGTAETILQMRKDVEGVEDSLERVGKRCGRTVVGGMVGGLGRLEQAREEGSMKSQRDQMSWIARMKVLGMCGIIIGGLLRRGGAEKVGGRGVGLVLAAKVHVLARRLLKSLSDSSVDGLPQEKCAIEEARKKIARLKSKLLRGVERTLEKVSDDVSDDDRGDLLQALCAYSLATSSGAKDVLRHFLHVRGDTIAFVFEEESGIKDNEHGILKALRLYTKTLLDVQALAPKRLSEALARLKTKHLLKDESIRLLDGLSLDVHERWFGSEILNFTPYVRHDDLDGPQAVETLRGWAKRASEVLLTGLQKTLKKTQEFKTVVGLRTQILEVWIKNGGKARGFDPSVLLDDLRKVINQRMVQLLEGRASKLHLVGTEVEGTLGSWRAGITDQHHSLWDGELLDLDVSNGASSFKQGILSRTHGKNNAVSKAVAGYQTWWHLIDEIATVIEQLRIQRWDDDLEDIEDDLSLESRNTLLSQDDPKMLQDCLDQGLERAFQELHNRISSLLVLQKKSENIGQISIYIIRVLRSIRTSLPAIEAVQTFGLSIIPELHKNLALAISSDVVEKFAGTFKRKRVAGRLLWEGSPELPVQPSPGTFAFLHSLSKAMAEVGQDVWSPAAVLLLKQHLCREIGQRWMESLQKPAEVINGTAIGEEKSSTVHAEEANKEAMAGETSTEEVPAEETTTEEAPAEEDKPAVTKAKPTQQDDIFKQSLFDVFVLQAVMNGNAPDSEDNLHGLYVDLNKRLDLESSEKRRLELGAKDYWKRTSLLFGLLA
ncbi:hypothetical protein BP5796_08735 [Coleophoma crateriformis]|uniref:Conserved oligomeric Golgi complex subunit 1 n=1 Tax=Coleophoma crateriformis TaxID=565419 RepID=A0A3D8R8V4_9HELO|nr:hypothetical protein BP5796_08735 [Coleophoma crateriformis]